MATTDMNAQIHIKDGNGNVNNIFPATKIANVEGLTSALNAKADTTTVNNQLSGKVDKETGKGLSTNDYTTAEKNKLSGIEAQANKTTVDSALSSSSTNPVQNKVVNAALDRISYVSPEMFDGSTDVQKIQNAIDYACNNNIHNIVLNKKYDITGGTIYFDNLPENVEGEGTNHTNRNLFRIIGLSSAEIYKGDSGFIFDARVMAHGLCVQNIKFTGNSASSRSNRCDVFNAKSILRVVSINNYYNYLRNVFYSKTGVHSVMQSYKTFGDSAIDCLAYVSCYTTMTDCAFTSATIESCDYGFFINTDNADSTIIGLNITNCVIEGMSEYGIKVDSSQSQYTVYLAGFGLYGNYFESSNKAMIVFGKVVFMNCTVENNTFSINNFVDAYCIHLHVTQNSENIRNLVFINNNFSNGSANAGGCFYSDNTNSFSPYVIMIIGKYNNLSNAPTLFSSLSKHIVSSEKISVSGVSTFAMPIKLGVGDSCTLFAVDNDNDDYFFEYKIVRKSDGFHYYLIANNRMVITLINEYGTVMYNLSQAQNITVYTEALFSKN